MAAAPAGEVAAEMFAVIAGAVAAALFAAEEEAPEAFPL